MPLSRGSLAYQANPPIAATATRPAATALVPMPLRRGSRTIAVSYTGSAGSAAVVAPITPAPAPASAASRAGSLIDAFVTDPRERPKPRRFLVSRPQTG